MSYPEVAIGRIGGLSHRNCERLQMERVWDGGEFADNFGVRRLVGGQNQSTMFDGTRHAATDAVELGVEHDADGMALAIRYATNRNGEDAKHAMLTDVAFRFRPFVADVEHTIDLDAIAAVRAASAVPLIGGVVLAGKGQQRFGLLLVPLAYTWSPLDRHAQELLTKRLRQRAAQHPGQIAYDPETLRRAGANLLTATLLYLAVTSFATNA